MGFPRPICLRLVLLGLVFAGAQACQSYEVEEPEFCCWFASAGQDVTGLQRCVFSEFCREEDGQWVCPCPDGCQCASEPPQGDEFALFDCAWQQDECYRGDAASMGEEVGSCSCMARFPCWEHCLGHETAEGQFECEVDGEKVACVLEPPLDEDQQAHFCAAGLLAWSMDVAEDYYGCANP